MAKEVVVEHALDRALIGWLGHCGPVTAAELHEALGLELQEIDHSLLRLEATGAILRGHFRTSASPKASADGAATAVEAGLEWCDRRLLARIHRLTVATLRKQVEPVTPAQFMRWLLRWQHVAPGTQLSGERGLLEALRQLQGFEIPASAWERQILARRVRDYDPEALDRLCLTGAVGWGRLSPHPATVDDSGERSSAGDGATERAKASASAGWFRLQWLRSRFFCVKSATGCSRGTKKTPNSRHEGCRQRRARFSNFYASAAHRFLPTSCAEPED